ncbi:MAG TPA: response regulator [Thermoanaerobaculia bacterium]|nr:response regulator [Thermoanaerobaculia bacterium]
MRRALVCDDDRSIRTMLHALLRHSHFDVETVDGGGEAIARLAEPFDLVVLDLMMPNTSGYDVLDHIQRTNPQLLQRVIVATAHAAIVRQPLTTPVAAVLVKPFDLHEFMQAVHDVIVKS